MSSKFKKRNKGSKKPLSNERNDNSGIDSYESNSQEAKESKNNDNLYKRCVVKPGRYNDPSWYYRNEQDLRDNFSISSGPSLGLATKLSDNIYSSPEFNFMLPGLAIYNIALLPGFSDASTSALNLASFKIFSRIKRTVTSNLPYDPQNVMIYLLAMDSIYAIWIHLVRLYKILQTYSAVNRYTPKILVNSLGFNFDMLISNLSNFRSFLNVVQQKLNSMYVPNVLSFFTRHQWLFSNIYQDENMSKAQLYLLAPTKVYKYVESTASESIGKLTHVNRVGGTLNDIVSYVNNLIEPIIGSQDMNRIAGDLEKAYGSEKAFFLPVIEENMSIDFVADMSVLSQLENADIVNNLDNTDVTESDDGSFLVCKPTYVPLLSASTTPPRWNRKLLNFHLETIEPRFVAEAIRFCCVSNITTNEIDVVGTEIVQSITLVTTLSNGQSDSFTFNSNYLFMDDNGQGSRWINGILKYASGFDRFTIFRYSRADAVTFDTVTNPIFHSFIGDLAHTVTLDKQILRQMHDSALLAMFDDEKT